MVKFPEADARIFRHKFVCRKCKTVVKASSQAMMEGKVKCKKCHAKTLRTKRKK